MKKLFYTLITLLILPFASNAQNEKIIQKKEQPTFKNQIDLDVQFLGVDFLYKHKLANNFFIGGGLGLGGFLNLGTNGTYAEFIRSKILFDYNINQNFHIYQVSTYSILTYDSSNDSFIQTLRFGLGIFHRISKIEIGIEPSLILSEKYPGQLVTSLIIIKIPLNRW